MQVKNKVIVVTGAAGGIGRALAQRFTQEGAAAVVCADLNKTGAEETAAMCGAIATAYELDVSSATQVEQLVADTQAQHGHIDLFCANAGIGGASTQDTPDEQWQRTWEINLMSHVYAARYALPGMVKRGSGYLLNTASAAGLLTQIGSVTYAVTKHAAVAFAEYLSINYGDKGIGVSVLCPQAVRTAMTAGSENGGVAGVDGMIEPEDVAEEVIQTLEEERFLVLPHKEVLTYMQRKAADYDRWLGGMRRLRERYDP